MEENRKIWTTNDTAPPNLSRVSTANAAVDQSMTKAPNQYMVGIQSKFKRKYYHKTIFLLLIAIIVCLLIGIIIIACYLKKQPNICESKECVRIAAGLLASMDETVDPCDDFYKFTCGNWADTHPRPESAHSADWFSERQVHVMRKIRDFLKRNASANEPIPILQARLLYATCMDTPTMDRRGLTPLFRLLAEYRLPQVPGIFNLTIANVTGNFSQMPFDWVDTLARYKKSFGSDLLIGFDIFADPRNKSSNRIILGSPNLEATLTLKDDDAMVLAHKAKRKIAQEMDDIDDDGERTASEIAYTAYMTEMMGIVALLTAPDLDIMTTLPIVQDAAKLCLNMTKEIFKLVERAENLTKPKDFDLLESIRDLTVVEVQNLTDTAIAPLKSGGNIFEKYVKSIMALAPTVNVDLSTEKMLTSEPDLMYFADLMRFINATPVAHLELLIWWTIVEVLIVHTTTEMRTLHDTYAKSFVLTEGCKPRSLYCVGVVNQMMGMAVSAAIVEPDFLLSTRPKVERMLTTIRQAFEELVVETRWMDDKTKRVTLEKSQAMQSLIGFPEWVVDNERLEMFYKGIILRPNQHLENMISILHWQFVAQINNLKMNNSVTWALPPTHVNAFHTFQANTITIPLAILQYPFYHLGLEVLNYGSIGTILGHELTHGFDDSGRKYDKDGNIRQWWTSKTINEYVNRTSCFVKQYNGYFVPAAKDYINGELTLGENIADNGGLREAFRAYQIYSQTADVEPKLPGLERFSQNQLFFLSFGNLWCGSSTAMALQWALDDSHSPSEFRLRGVLANSPEFTHTFNCPLGSGMFPSEERCRIW